MKILMTTFRSYPTEKQYADFIRFQKLREILEGFGHEVIIVSKGYNLKFIPGPSGYSIPSLSIPFLGEIILFFVASHYVNKIAKNEKADIVFVNSVFYSSLFRKTRQNYKTWLDIMGIEHLEAQKKPLLFRLIAPYIRKYEILSMKKADIISTINEAHGKIIRSFSGKNYFVIRDAIDINMASGISGTTTGKKKEGVNILFVGSIVNRRLDALFNVFPELNKTIGNIKLSIIGDGPDKDYYRELAERKGFSNQINFIGYVQHDKLSKYFPDADLCFSDDWSKIGFPVKVYEYMLAGKAVVVENTAATKEIVQDGVNGFLYENEKELLSLLKKLAKSPELCRSIGKEARKFIIANHTWKNRASLVEKVVKDVS